MIRILKEDSLAIGIDIQERLFPHMHAKESLLPKMQTLIKGFRHLGLPIMLTEQYKKGLGNTISEIESAFGDDLPEGIMRPEKKHFSVLDHEAASAEIHRRSPKNLLLFGIESHVCVLQTAIDAIEVGFKPIVVVDATSSRNIADKETALARLTSEGAKLTSVEAILFELCRVSGTETFKSISALVK